MEAKRILALNDTTSHSKLGNFEYAQQPLHLGELKGNHFKILIKRVECESDEVIKTAVESLAKNGFINYYGLQRFGTYKVPTYLIGKSIIQRKWTDVSKICFWISEALAFRQCILPAGFLNT